MNEVEVMQEKRLYNLQIDETFKKLIPPLASNEQKQLEENIIKDGCREPLCIWGNIIVDGHNRYGICTRLKIPFHIQQMDFNYRDEVITWICANQLGRRNISEESRRYLIGKRYETEKKLKGRNLSGKNQHSEKEVCTQIENKPQNQAGLGLTAARIGKEYHISKTTVIRYGKYAKSMDRLANKDPELIAEILAGKIKISKDNISKLSKQSFEVVNNVKNQITNTNNNFVTYSDSRKIIPVKREKVTVKNMPDYDPDAEISSLALTIPSWVKSVDRALSTANFNKISNKGRTKLKNELKNLEYAVNVILLALEEQ